MKKLLTSIGVTLLVSSLFALLFKSWYVFLLSTVMQFVFFYFFNSIYENYLIQKAAQINLQTLKEENKNKVKVLCPCGENNPQDVTLNFNEDTLYECSKCKKQVRATSNVGTSLVTLPVFTKK